jgi:hypothetical protein
MEACNGMGAKNDKRQCELTDNVEEAGHTHDLNLKVAIQNLLVARFAERQARAGGQASQSALK